jgi:UDP-glucose 4-epimerase
LTPTHQVIAATRGIEARGKVFLDIRKTIEVEALPKIDAVVHLAQANHKHANRDEIFQINAESTSQLLDYAIRVGAKHFILTSTGNVYRPSPERLDENSPTAESDAYSASKILAEKYALQRKGNINIVILRLFTPYGPGQTGRMIPSIAELVRNGRSVVLRNGGQPAVTPIYIDDLCSVIHEALDLNGTHIVNVGGDEVANVHQLAKMCGDILGKEPNFAEERVEKDWNLIADTTRMRSLFPRGNSVSLQSGLAKTLGL